MFRYRRLSLALSVALLPLVGPVASADAAAVTTGTVGFTVVNRNTSAVPCPADGREYEIVGHLTGPSRALKARTVRAATLYVHGDAVDESLWRYQGRPGYDYVGQMARAGFVSVTISRLGYPGSGRPNGNEVCIGSEADVVHQVIEQLRAGTYTVRSGPKPTFERLTLAGHSLAGFIAMAEAYSYRDVDALAVVASGEFVKPRTFAAVAGQQSRCPGSRDGYEFIATSDEEAAADFFHDADPEVIADVVPKRPKDACGPLMHAPASMLADLAMLRTIDVPVLVITGTEDAFFDEPSKHAGLFTGSPNVQSRALENTGHAITLGRSAPTFLAAMQKWLTERER